MPKLNLGLEDYRMLLTGVQEADRLFLMQEWLDIAEFENEKERQKILDDVYEQLVSLNIIKDCEHR